MQETLVIEGLAVKERPTAAPLHSRLLPVARDGKGARALKSSAPGLGARRCKIPGALNFQITLIETVKEVVQRAQVYDTHALY